MKTKEERAEIARQRVRDSLSKMTPAKLLDRAMELYEERNAMSEKLRIDYIREGIEGLKPVHPDSLAEYEREMKEAIPQIVQAVNDRARLADDARRRFL